MQTKKNFKVEFCTLAELNQQQPEGERPETWKEANKPKQPLTVLQQWSLGHLIEATGLMPGPGALFGRFKTREKSCTVKSRYIKG